MGPWQLVLVQFTPLLLGLVIAVIIAGAKDHTRKSSTIGNDHGDPLPGT